MLPSDNVIEVNSETHTDYTYHRHSAPKDVVYYRCSDKRCKARLHFNQKTGEVTLKNHHLVPDLHKKPKLSRVIAIDSLPLHEGARRRGRCTPAPVLTKEPVPVKDETLLCLERLPEDAPSRSVTLLNESCYTLRFSISDPGNAAELVRSAVYRGLALKGSWGQGLTSIRLSSQGLETEEMETFVDLEMLASGVRAVRTLAAEAGARETGMFCLL